MIAVVQDIGTIAMSITSPIMLAVMITWLYNEIKHIKQDVEEVKEKVSKIDSVLDEYVALTKYLQGRMNGIEKMMNKGGDGKSGKRR